MIIQFNCPKCRSEDWGRSSQWVSIDKNILADMALVIKAIKRGSPEPDTWISDDDWNHVKKLLGWKS